MKTILDELMAKRANLTDDDLRVEPLGPVPEGATLLGVVESEATQRMFALWMRLGREATEAADTTMRLTSASAAEAKQGKMALSAALVKFDLGKELFFTTVRDELQLWGNYTFALCEGWQVVEMSDACCSLSTVVAAVREFVLEEELRNLKTDHETTPDGPKRAKA